MVVMLLPDVPTMHGKLPARGTRCPRGMQYSLLRLQLRGLASPHPRRGDAQTGAMSLHRFVEVKEVQYATLLSEMAYRAVDCSDEASWQAAKADIELEVGCSLPVVQRHRSGGQRYLVGETDSAIYVAFQGTKHVTDWLANLHFIHAPFWQHKQHCTSRSKSFGSSSSSSSSSSARAHNGFIRRANQSALSISALQQSAAATGKRLVLTGHSLGGAVATLTTVRLLRSLHTTQSPRDSSSGNDEDPQIRCISFATPAVANTDLLQEVSAAGWDKYITNIVLPEDPVVPFVNLLLKAPTHPAATTADISNFSKAAVAATATAAATVQASFAPQSIPGAWRSGRLSSSSSSDSVASPYSYSAQQQQQQRGHQLAYAYQATGPASWDYSLQSQYSQCQQYQPVQAAAGVYGYSTADAGASDELVSWLSAAEGAVQQQRLSLTRSLSAGSSDLHYSTSSNSLYSMQSSTADSASSVDTVSSTGSITSFMGRLEASFCAASASASHFFAGRAGAASNSSGPTSSPESPSRAQRYGLSRVRIAVLAGALAAGARCAAALAAPHMLAHQLSAVSMFSRGLSAPLAVAAAHLVGTLWLKSTVPVSHPLGQQWVLTAEGLQQVAKPLKAYPKNGQDLGLQQLGGFAPGHRMIAYRRRVVKLILQEQQ